MVPTQTQGFSSCEGVSISDVQIEKSRKFNVDDDSQKCEGYRGESWNSKIKKRFPLAPICFIHPIPSPEQSLSQLIFQIHKTKKKINH